jgi:hypothetical protein
MQRANGHAYLDPRSSANPFIAVSAHTEDHQ